MAKLNRHPHATMADFVNKYQYIKPFLEKGDLETANVGIGEVLWRYDKCIETNGDLITCLKANIQAVLRYIDSVNLLEGFYDKTCEIPLPNKVEVMASCDHLEDKLQRPFVLPYSRTGKQDNRDCFTQAVFPTTSCYNNKKKQVYKSLYSNSSPTKQSYGRRLLGDKVKKMNNLAFLMIKGDVAELDFILSEDEIYEKYRQREVFA